jgi:hypothetical protein
MVPRVQICQHQATKLLRHNCAPDAKPKDVTAVEALNTSVPFDIFIH